MIYLASPYSHPDEHVRHYRWWEVLKVTARMVAAGMFPFSPIVHSHDMARIHGMAFDHAAWQSYDEHMLGMADALYVLMVEGWQESVGVASEVAFAEARGIPVHYVSLEWQPGNCPEVPAMRKGGGRGL